MPASRKLFFWCCRILSGVIEVRNSSSDGFKPPDVVGW
jgi:hypothetical protein